MTAGYNRFSGTPAGEIIKLLQTRGGLTIKEIEDALGVTTTAVRQQIGNLLAEGLVRGSTVRKGIGRPHVVYKLTERANKLFACKCDELALSLYEELVALEGLPVVHKLLDRVGKRLAADYEGQIKGEILSDRVHQLAQMLDRKGILTSVENLIDPNQEVIVLHEYTCPYHELVQKHREICDMEIGMMERALDAQVSVSNCMLDGHTGCEFLVRTKESNERLKAKN